MPRDPDSNPAAGSTPDRDPAEAADDTSTSDTDTESDFDHVVRAAAAEILANPLRSDVIGVGELEEVEQVREAADVSEDALRTAIGSVLSQADYADKVARNKYRINDSEEGNEVTDSH